MATLMLFTDSVCFSRERGISIVREVLRYFPRVLFKEINMFEHPEQTRQLGIKMSPTLVLGKKIISVGIPDKEELKGILSAELKEIKT